MSRFGIGKSPSQQGADGLTRWRRLWWAAPLLLVVCAVVAFAAWIGVNLRPPSQDRGRVQVIIRPGESVFSIAEKLQAAGLIRNATVFRWYLRYTEQGVDLKAGTYRLPLGESLPSLVHDLVRGKDAAVVRVTIPEGFTVTQIADRLQAAGVVKRQAFLHEVEHGQFSEPFLKSLPNNKQVRWRLEGYLFPDTYEFDKGESAHDVVDDMLADFQQRVASPLGPVIKQRGLSLPEVITEASLIEKEAEVNRERPIIASVIDNRLHHKPPMKLQIDATIEYILGHRNVVTVKDTRVKSPYNTYLYYGLPPGPIANPGSASIRAVLYPAKTDYLYYVAKNNGSGEHYFAVTYAQQLRNEAKSQHNLSIRS
ncbi:endolytic transglycosylase MltG [Alicyclobacillus herbarius]|uniref:endolytic transglycosylase MltG n=1 Tax=Alicyclobacillus herbarius TaxID=122960 RepID=UPI0023537E81|nr:endolytic transglycosylase MltG [Alicyclobacillus herbarius]